jgi:hypothetical protein
LNQIHALHAIGASERERGIEGANGELRAEGEGEKHALEHDIQKLNANGESEMEREGGGGGVSGGGVEGDTHSRAEVVRVLHVSAEGERERGSEGERGREGERERRAEWEGEKHALEKEIQKLHADDEAHAALEVEVSNILCIVMYVCMYVSVFVCRYAHMHGCSYYV